MQSSRRRRLVGVTPRVVFGIQLAIEPLQATCGWTLNTSFVERLTRDLRQRGAAIGRRVHTRCQGEAGWREQLALVQGYHTCVLPHARLRPPLPVPEGTNGRGAVQVWRPCTPARAAGLPEHVWSLREVLGYRVPPWSQPPVR